MAGVPTSLYQGGYKKRGCTGSDYLLSFDNSVAFSTAYCCLSCGFFLWHFRFHLEFAADFYQVDSVSYHILCFLDHSEINHAYTDTTCLALDTL